MELIYRFFSGYKSMPQLQVFPPSQQGNWSSGLSKTDPAWWMTLQLSM